MKRQNAFGFERLEDRSYLAVDVAVDEGQLLVSGIADGAVEIVAIDATTYEVRDNGVVVATAEGVAEEIRISLDAGGATDDNVTINLVGQTIGRIMADLGNGNNSLTIAGGTVGSLRLAGGDGADGVSSCLSRAAFGGDDTPRGARARLRRRARSPADGRALRVA